MKTEIVAYDHDLMNTWDDFCAKSINGTFQHSRLFLEYHKERFDDASVLFMEAGNPVGILPAAIKPADSTAIISHPGATYGGIVHQGKLLGDSMIEAVRSLREYYSHQGFRRLQYKAVPHIYASTPAQDDIYALYNLGATLTRCDLSCCIDLDNRRKPSTRRKRGLKKALTHVTLENDIIKLEELWSVIVENLSRKHKAKPVHSLNELRELVKRFPERISISTALLDGRVVAGIIFFNTSLVWHAQYIASSETGYNTSALDAVFEFAIDMASENGARYFDFGTSNEDEGRVLNAGLYRFKSEFGGSGIAHQHYEMTL